jgi:hypothetical protein
VLEALDVKGGRWLRIRLVDAEDLDAAKIGGDR